MNVLVFGLGALGTVYSCLLKKSGHRVVALARGANTQMIKDKGVHITGIWNEHSARLDNVITGIKQVEEKKFDLILVTVKSYATGSAAREIAGLVSPGTLVVLLQNGYGNYESAAEYIPRERLVLARVIFGAETIAPGESRVTVIADEVVLGSPDDAVSVETLENLAGVFKQAGIPSRASGEVIKYVWGKIIYNSALNPLGALLNVEYGKLAGIKHTRKLMDGIINEIFDLLHAMGQETLWPNAETYRREFYNKMVPTTASHHSSMLQDIIRGRMTEIDALNGAVVSLGKEYGVPTPVNEVITRMVKTREQLG